MQNVCFFSKIVANKGNKNTVFAHNYKSEKIIVRANK